MSENKIKPVAFKSEPLFEGSPGMLVHNDSEAAKFIHLVPQWRWMGLYDQSAIDRLTAERDAAVDAAELMESQLHELTAERDEAQRKLSVAVANGNALVADAERYQWLVDSGRFCPSFYNKGWGLRSSAFERSTKESLDAAIDAARAEGGV